MKRLSLFIIIVSENVHNSCSLIKLHTYSAKVIVVIISPGNSLRVKQTDMDDNDTWDYIIIMPLIKGKVDDVSGLLCEH